MRRTHDGPELERMERVPLLEQLRWQDIVLEETDPDALRMLNWWVKGRVVVGDPTIAATFARLWKTDREAETNG